MKSTNDLRNNSKPTTWDLKQKSSLHNSSLTTHLVLNFIRVTTSISDAAELFTPNYGGRSLFFFEMREGSALSSYS
jgi:hypothetical protein